MAPSKKVIEESYKKDIFNIEVEDDNSYTANGMIVHNCQWFSFAGKRKGAATKCNIKITELEQYLELKREGFEFDGQSYLFWEYVRIKKELEKYNPDLIFLLENVKMDKQWKEMFDRTMGVVPVRINSSLVSAQIRDRFYWCSKEGIPQPIDREVLWNSVQMDKAEDVMYYSAKAFEWIFKDEKRKARFKLYRNTSMEKMQQLESM